MTKFSPLLTAWNWLKKQYPLLLLFALYALWLWGLIESIKNPIFPYHYDRIATFVVLGLDLLLPIYGMVATCFHLHRPHAWRNAAKIWMQCTLAYTVIDFIDLYCLVTPAVLMSEFLSVEIINAILPTTASIYGLYQIHKGSAFSPRQIARYILALTLGGYVGTLGLYIWYYLFQH